MQMICFTLADSSRTSPSFDAAKVKQSICANFRSLDKTCEAHNIYISHHFDAVRYFKNELDLKGNICL